MCLSLTGQRSSGLQANEQRTVTSCFTSFSPLPRESEQLRLRATANSFNQQLQCPRRWHTFSLFTQSQLKSTLDSPLKTKLYDSSPDMLRLVAKGSSRFHLINIPKPLSILVNQTGREKKNKPHSSSSPSSVKRERVKVRMKRKNRTGWAAHTRLLLHLWIGVTLYWGQAGRAGVPWPADPSSADTQGPAARGLVESRWNR